MNGIASRRMPLAFLFLFDSSISAADPRVGVLAGHKSPVLSAEFNADGTRVLTVGMDNTARLWDAKAGKELTRFAPAMALIPFETRLAFAKLSPDAKRVLTYTAFGYPDGVTESNGSTKSSAAALCHEKTRFELWDAATGKPIAAWNPDLTNGFMGAQPFNPAFSPDGKTVAITFGTFPDCAVRVHATDDGRELFRLKDHAMPVVDIAFSPDGKTIATASQDETARLWNAEDGKLLHTLKGHIAGVVSVVFSPDGSRLLTLGDGRNHYYDQAKKNESSSGASSGTATMERVFARLWDTATGKELAGMAWSGDDGSKTAKVDLGPLGIRVETKFGSGNKGFVRLARFSPDGKTILTAGAVGNASGNVDQNPAVRDAASGKALRTFKLDNPRDILVAGLSPDGGTVAVAMPNGTLRFWHAASGKEGPALAVHRKPIRSLAFSPDGKVLLTASEDGTAAIHDAPNR